MAALNGQEIIDKFNNLTDDELEAGDEFALQLANDSKDEIESELKLNLTEDTDASNSTTQGQTHSTAVSMPSDFLAFQKPYIYVGQVKYYQKPLSDKMKWKDSPHLFYYDPSDGIHLCGTQNSVETITIPYAKATPDLELTTYPIWPARFHTLIAMRMVLDYNPINQGEREESYQPEWFGLYTRKLAGFVDWDIKQKLMANGGASGYRDDNNDGLPLGRM